MKIEAIQDMFFQECADGLAQAEEGLLALQSGTADDETVNTIFRAVHSIKGGSGAFSFTALQNFTHHFETLLDQVRSGELAVTPQLITSLLTAFDILADHVAAARGEAPAPDDAAVLAQLQLISSGSDETACAAGAGSAPDLDLGFSLDAMIGAIEESMAPAEDWERSDDEQEPPVPPEKAAGTVRMMTVRPLDGAMANGGEPLLLIRELVDLGATIDEVDCSAMPSIDDFEPTRSYLAWRFALPSTLSRDDVEEIFEFVSDCCRLEFDEVVQEVTEPQEPTVDETAPPVEPVEVAAPITPSLEKRPQAPAEATPPPVEVKTGEGPAPAQAAGITPTIRVDLEKLDRLVNLVGELVITQSMLAQRLVDYDLSNIDELLDLDHLTRELQDSAMSIRAQPIRSVFGRVPRIIRECQASTGKLVNLQVDGESTELDQTIVERIGEPLTHLIRNAIDHGLESPEERIASGKPEAGHVRLSAGHRSGKVLISVTDDGRGINREKVLAKAIERGLVGPDAKLSNEEIDNLIFAPGFSTADSVSNISGRGVGMDVVRRNIAALGGRISIASRPGEGSTFTMALPLTLAILDGMIVKVSDQTFVVPLNHIVETLRPRQDVIKNLGAGQPMLNVRGCWLPVLSVARELAVPGGRTDPTEGVLIVVETEAAGRGVIMVDEIVDQRQVVIKSLETNYGCVEGIAGATILGNGQVALILDVETITSSIRSLEAVEASRGLAA